MKEGPDIARLASLIGDPARANILTALMDGRALTASGRRQRYLSELIRRAIGFRITFGPAPPAAEEN